MNTFRLPDETRVSRVHLRTANLARAVDFYERVIGFKMIECGKSEASLSATGGAPALLVFTEDPNATPHPKQTTGLYHFAIRFPTRRDLAHAVLRLSAADYSIDGASDHDFGHSIYVSDPDGNGVELYFDLPRSEWPPRRNGRIVVTGTKPLDFDDLLAAVEGEPVPSFAATGTDIGHINLHVAGLADAEKFFHDFLGLEITAHIGSAGRFLAAGGYHHQIAINTWAGKTPAPASSVGLISYRLGVPNRDAVAELKKRAPLFGYEARMAGDLLQVCDPNGNRLEVEVMPERHGCPRNTVLGELKNPSDDARVMRKGNGRKI